MDYAITKRKSGKIRRRPRSDDSDSEPERRTRRRIRYDYSDSEPETETFEYEAVPTTHYQFSKYSKFPVASALSTKDLMAR